MAIFILINARGNSNNFRVKKITHLLKKRFLRHSVFPVLRILLKHIVWLAETMNGNERSTSTIIIIVKLLCKDKIPFGLLVVALSFTGCPKISYLHFEWNFRMIVFCCIDNS